MLYNKLNTIEKILEKTWTLLQCYICILGQYQPSIISLVIPGKTASTYQVPAHILVQVPAQGLVINIGLVPAQVCPGYGSAQV